MDNNQLNEYNFEVDINENENIKTYQLKEIVT